MKTSAPSINMMKWATPSSSLNTLGRMTRTFYDDLNRAYTTVTNWNPATLTTPADCVLSSSNSSEENICSFSGYDDAGRMITTTNALNQTSLTVYDAANRPFLTVANWDGTPITSEANCSFPPAQIDTNLCSVTSYDSLGRRSSSKDPAGHIVEFDYDGLGRVLTTTRYLNDSSLTQSTSYDALGNRRSQTNARGYSTTFTYDSLNRQVSSTSAEGVVNSNSYNTAGWLLASSDGLGHQSVITYDDLGRRTTTTDAANNTTTVEYDGLGNQIAITDAENVKTSYGYDGLNRLVTVIENDVAGINPTNETDVVTIYSYDAVGNRTLTINARGYTNTHVLYDTLNRPIVETDALGNQMTTSYNALGQRTVITDGNSAVTHYAYDGLNRITEIDYLADGETVSSSYDVLGNRKVMIDSVGTTSYDYDDLNRLISVTDPFTSTVGYGYDLVGNRTQLTYPDGKVVTTSYDMDNRMTQVKDWDSGTTGYGYDGAGRLITTTLPNGVVSVNGYDDANRLLNLSHTSGGGVLIANYEYGLDKVGNRTTATETIRQPGELASTSAFLEANGQLVLEAESGTVTAGSSHAWNSQMTQSDYAGTAYMRALPDSGQQYEANATNNSPGLNFAVQIDNPDSYTVWARGMAPDAGGDSLHVGVNDGTPTTAANLTGFAPNEWSWSRLTMSNTNAMLDLSSGGTYTLNISMREDGLRLDKLLLVTDTAAIPTGQGPLESPTITDLPNLSSHTIQYNYDPLYRLTNAGYTGNITATYSYEYDPVGNMTAFTETVGITVTTDTRTFNDANQLQMNIKNDTIITSYNYDRNGNMLFSDPPDESNFTYYFFNQRNLLVDVRISLNQYHVVDYYYDGNGNRLQQVIYEPFTGSPQQAITTTYHNDNMGLSQVLIADDGTTQTVNLYGLDLIHQDDGTQTRTLLTDGLGRARVEMVGTVIETVSTYEPYGKLLSQTGASDTVYGFTGEQEDGAAGLVYLRGRYYNPSLKVFMSRDPYDPSSLTAWLQLCA